MGRLGLVCHQLMPRVLGTVLRFTGGDWVQGGAVETPRSTCFI